MKIRHRGKARAMWRFCDAINKLDTHQRNDMNFSDMMKQAKQVQERMASLQEELAAAALTGTAGGGMVTATVNGKGELIGLSIEKEIVNPEEVHMLQDLIIAAVSDANRKAADLHKREMAKLTGGLNIPGMV
jgi:DNA-binding YbaB/EbfC family protein